MSFVTLLSWSTWTGLAICCIELGIIVYRSSGTTDDCEVYTGGLISYTVPLLLSSAYRNSVNFDFVI